MNDQESREYKTSSTSFVSNTDLNNSSKNINVDNNSFKTFDQLEKQKETYFKYKTIEIYRIQEERRNILKEQIRSKQRKDDLLKKQIENKLELEKIENQKKLELENQKRKELENQKKHELQKLKNEQIDSNKVNLTFSTEFQSKYLTNSSLPSFEQNIKTNYLPKQQKKYLKKRITQLSFNENQFTMIVNEIKSHFNQNMLPVISSTLIEQARLQVSSHLESYKIYSTLLSKLFQGDILCWLFMKRRMFLKVHDRQTFKSLVLIYFGYLYNINNISVDGESLEFLVEAIKNRNIYSLIVAECFFIVFKCCISKIDNNTRNRLKDIYKICKNEVYPVVSDSGIKSRVESFFTNL